MTTPAIQLGSVDPASIGTAQTMASAMQSSMNSYKRSTAMANHPAAGSRSAEFHQQAQAHLGIAQSNASRLQSMVSPAGSMPRPGPSNDPGMASNN
jgi:hypothetical protein